jgi:hypothetical protein
LKPGLIALVSGESSVNTAYSGPCIFIYLSEEQTRIDMQERRNTRHGERLRAELRTQTGFKDMMSRSYTESFLLF